MARATPHLDRARELVAELDAELELPDSDLETGLRRHEATLDAAIVHAHLAIAEALHGVVYVANAHAV